ncbi:MAG TPA: methionine biosynthesis protein MetW [Hyphomonadaceae bacterium]|jgi:methionine biosynthesis protein MetW|nr:methionine biosynthesis protein MetW [Hyphomonadaceae bacterium]
MSAPTLQGQRRADHVAIAQFINKGDLVLDVGCGDGQLMELLQSERGARTRGLEVEQAGVNRCMSKGLAVVQGDADNDLPVYPDDAYDVAILSKTIQELARPKFVLAELARISRKVIISFRNYGHWKVRTTLFRTGRIPSLSSGDTGWWSDGARRPCTARDMADLANELDLHITAATAVSGQPVSVNALSRLNWTAEELVFVLERGKAEAE